jgi:hypothetical protein
MQETPEQIRSTVKRRFAKVADSPHEKHPFAIGPESAKTLGYDAAEIDALSPCRTIVPRWLFRPQRPAGAAFNLDLFNDRHDCSHCGLGQQPPAVLSLAALLASALSSGTSPKQQAMQSSSFLWKGLCTGARE